MSEHLALPRPVSPALAADLEKAAAYVSPGLAGLRVTADRGAVEWSVRPGTDAAQLAGMVERFVRDLTARHRELPRRVVGTRAPAPGRVLHADVESALRARGWVQDLGPGQVGLTGPALAVFRAVDREAAQAARELFGAVEERYPALIPTEVLAKCGYLAGFPHALNFVTHLAEDYDGIERFRQDNLQARTPQVPVCALATPNLCLKPAVCYHCYRSLENLTVPAPGRSVTCEGKVYRYESANLSGLERLWEFTQRDIVWVGQAGWVAEQRERIVAWALGQLGRWDLDGVIETANDPFFPAAHAAKSYWQSLAELKYELRLPLAPDAAGQPRMLAASSFNLHQDFMGQAFNIRVAGGETAHSGCVGWGLERWVLAIFTRHGVDLDQWPATVRARLDAP